MRLQLDAAPEELCRKAHQVLNHLAAHCEGHDAELADALRKALPPPHTQTEHRALRELQAQMREAYAAEMAKVMAQAADLFEEAHAHVI